MSREGLATFASWASRYDETLRAGAEGYPSAGYADVLAAVADAVRRSGATTVLDLGIGAGALAARLLDRDPALRVWGVDFSGAMLEQARRKLPGATLLRADPRDVPTLPLHHVGAVVATYALHELPDDEKAALIEHLLRERLAPGGVLAVGDIAFGTRAERDAARAAAGDAWDPDEHPFVAEEFRSLLDRRGIGSAYRHVSICGGMFSFDAPTRDGRESGRGLAVAPRLPVVVSGAGRATALGSDYRVVGSGTGHPSASGGAPWWACPRRCPSPAPITPPPFATRLFRSLAVGGPIMPGDAASPVRPFPGECCRIIRLGGRARRPAPTNRCASGHPESVLDAGPAWFAHPITGGANGGSTPGKPHGATW